MIADHSKNEESPQQDRTKTAARQNKDRSKKMTERSKNKERPQQEK